MDLIIKYLPVIGVTSFIPFFALIIKSIALLKVTSVEKVLQNEQQKLIAYTIQIFYASLAIAYISTVIAIFINSKININTVVALFLFILLMSLLVTPTIVFVVKSFLKKKWYHFIEYPEPITNQLQKYYIHKVTQNGEIILGKETIRNEYVILVKRDDILKIKIHRESI